MISRVRDESRGSATTLFAASLKYPLNVALKYFE